MVGFGCLTNARPTDQAMGEGFFEFLAPCAKDILHNLHTMFCQSSVCSRVFWTFGAEATAKLKE